MGLLAGVVEWAGMLGDRWRALKGKCPGVITGLRGSGWEGNIQGRQPNGSTGGGMCQPGRAVDRPEKICTPESSPAQGRDRTVRGVRWDISTGRDVRQPGAAANRPEKICTPESSPARGRDRTVRGLWLVS